MPDVSVNNADGLRSLLGGVACSRALVRPWAAQPDRSRCSWRGRPSMWEGSMSDPISRLEFARREIDRVFGSGHARQHPEVVVAVM